MIDLRNNHLIKIDSVLVIQVRRMLWPLIDDRKMTSHRQDIKEKQFPLFLFFFKQSLNLYLLMDQCYQLFREVTGAVQYLCKHRGAGLNSQNTCYVRTAVYLFLSSTCVTIIFFFNNSKHSFIINVCFILFIYVFRLHESFKKNFIVHCC